MKKLSIGVALMIMSISVFSQQDQAQTRMLWANGQVGTFSTVKKMGGFSGGLSLNGVKGNTMLKVRYFYDERFELFKPIERYNEMGLLAGKSYHSKYLQINLTAGLGITACEIVTNTTEIKTRNSGWVNIIENTEYIHEYDTFITPSIPLEVELMVKPLKVIGLGLSFSGNVNVVRPTFRTTLSVNIGKLR